LCIHAAMKNLVLLHDVVAEAGEGPVVAVTHSENLVFALNSGGSLVALSKTTGEVGVHAVVVGLTGCVSSA